MAKPQRSLTDGEQDIVRAQNDALVCLPREAEAQRNLILAPRKARQDMNDKIAQIKRDSNVTTLEGELTSKYKITKEGKKIIDILADMAPEARSRTIRVVVHYSDLFAWIFRDLFDEGAIAVGSNDDAGETAGFDKTGEGGRRGGAEAQPSHGRQADPAPPHTPTPGIPLDEALRRFEEEKAKAEGKRGAKSKAYKEAEAAYQAAQAAHDAERAAAAQSEEGGPPPPDEADSDAPPPPDDEGSEAEPSNVVSISQRMAEANRSGDQHIKEQAARLAAERKAKEAGEADARKPKEPAAEPAKPKRGRGKKVERQSPEEAAEASAGGPPPPDDASEEGEPIGGHRTPDRAPSYTQH